LLRNNQTARLAENNFIIMDKNGQVKAFLKKYEINFIFVVKNVICKFKRNSL